MKHLLHRLAEHEAETLDRMMNKDSKFYDQEDQIAQHALIKEIETACELSLYYVSSADCDGEDCSAVVQAKNPEEAMSIWLAWAICEDEGLGREPEWLDPPTVQTLTIKSTPGVVQWGQI
ncbi:MAG: hypothetical protein AAFX78_02650 [Cyanobacteria bacterium J06638_20]